MNSMSMLLINLIILLCPLMLYLFYCTYVESIDKEKNQTILDFLLLSCLYLIMTHYRMENDYNFIILLNIPLIIAMIKKRNVVIQIECLIMLFRFSFFILSSIYSPLIRCVNNALLY